MLPRFSSPRTCLLLTLVSSLFILINDEFLYSLLAWGLIWEEISLCRIHDASIALRRSRPGDPLIRADPLWSCPCPSWLLNVSYLILLEYLLIKRVVIQVPSDVRKNTRIWIIVPEDISWSRKSSNWSSMAPIKVVSSLNKRVRLPTVRHDSSCWKACFFVRIVC